MLPSICVISDSSLTDNINDTLKQCIDNGADWIGIREYDLDQTDLYKLCEDIIKYSETSGTLISVWNNPEIATELQIGLHMPSKNIEPSLKSKLDFDSPLGFSTHNENEILKCRGADYITISPVYDSISKHDYSGMNLDNFGKLCTYATQPVFALGGIDENNIAEVFECGAYGAVMCGAVMNNPNILKNILL